MAVKGNVRVNKINTPIFNENAQKIALALFMFFSLTSLIFVTLLPQKYDVKVGDVVQEDIRAKNDAINTIATRKLKQAAADAVPKKYFLDRNITIEAKNEISEFFNLVREVKAKNYLDDSGKIELLREMVPRQLTDETYQTAVKMDNPALNELEAITKAILEEVMESGIKEDAVDRAKAYIIEEFKKSGFAQSVRNVGEDLALAVVRFNMIYDREATEKEQQEAMQAVEPVRIARGQILIEKGTTVTAEQRQLLKELGLLVQDKRANLVLLMGAMLVVTILEGVLGFSIYFFHKKLYKNNLELLLLILIILSTLIATLGARVISNYMIPVAAGSMLISILINPFIAFVSSFVMSMAAGIMLGNDFMFSIIAFAGAMAGIYSTIKVSQRTELTKAGGIIGSVNFMLIVGLGLINNNNMLPMLIQSAWGFIGGILSAILAIGVLPFLESAFGITTAIKLLELSNPNQSLLKKLMIDAPGTYHHSIIVGNLAEAAAHAIGADGLLARVGANYHDVGKLKRPYFFIENQISSENPHDKLNPNLSALIITSHVKDGIAIAREYNLPQNIIDFIAQHHGNTVLSYFYNKALNDDPSVSEASFRYDGPKPKTKEVAIVMLADCSEAAVRSMKGPTPGKIEGLIRQIIKSKLDDGQLDECDLTLKDLDRIAVTFSQILAGVFHSRIEYPDKLKELQGKEAKNA